MEEKCILIVDDDDSIRELFKHVLEFAGYKVITANNGQAGLEMLKKKPRPCLVILDMLMPVMTGRGFLDEISKFEHYKEIPIIVVSATASKTEASGARKLIRKPADLIELLAAVDEYRLHNMPSLRTNLGSHESTGKLHAND